ncbi:MAG TPA: TerB family tellurite resistance protein [Kofleriaceae bacterium]|jgi:uncharacterized tellurite resistance protein B-like protein
MALTDHLDALADLLLGAAHADENFADSEQDEVRAILEDYAGELTAAVEKKLVSFDPEKYDLVKTAAAFAKESEDDRRNVLILVAQVTDADSEVDFAEDDYLREVCEALHLPKAALNGLTIDVVTDGPPPPPPRKS